MVSPPASLAVEPRGASAQLVDVHGKWDHALRRGIIVRERAWYELLQALDRALVQVTGSDFRIEQCEAAMDDHAVPVEWAMDLVHLERAPRMVRQHHQLRADPRPAEQPVVVVDVVDRLDVHPIAKRER